MKAKPSRQSRQNNGGKPKKKRVRPLAPEQLFNILGHINDGLVVLDKDWHYVFVNQKAATMLQRQGPSDLIGKHIWTEYPEGLGQPFHLAYEKAMREQIPIVFEDHYEPWDLWFENRIYPSPDSLLILFTEITDRKRVERLLNERQYLLQKILDTEPGTVYIYDLDERRNVYINRYWLLAFGYTEEETQAMGDELLVRIFHPEDLVRISAHHENWRPAGEGDIREIEYRVRTKAGEWRWLHSREVPFARDETGMVKQILGITHDSTERRLAQEALRQSEQQLELIYDTVSDIIFLLSIEADERYRFVSVNKAFLQATGLKSDQVVGKYADEIIPPASQPLVFERYRKAIQESIPVTWEDVSEYPAGIKTAIVTVNAAHNEAGVCTHLAGVLHDITERKRMEEVVLRERDFSDALLNSLPGVLYFYDHTGKFLRWNRNFQMVTGYAANEIARMHPLDFFVGEEKEHISRRIQEVFEKGQSYAEANLLLKSGKLIPYYFTSRRIDIDGLPYLIGTGIDISERKQMEEALRESEEKFSKVFHASPIPLSINRASDGRYVEVNGSFLERSGYQREEVIGRTAQDLGLWVYPAEREKMRRILLEQGSLRNFEGQFRTKSGRTGTALLFREIIELAGEKYFIGTSLDITERKEIEKAALKERDFSDAMLNSLPGIFYFYDEAGKFLRWNRNLEIVSGYSGKEIARMHPLDFFVGAEKEYLARRIQAVFEKGESDAEANFVTKNGELTPYYFTGRRIVIEGMPYLIGMGVDITQRKQAEAELRKLNLELEQRIAARTEELAAAMIRAQESDKLKSAFLASMSHELRTPLNSIIGFTSIILQGLAGPLSEEQTKQLNMIRYSSRHLLALINDVLDISKIEAGQLEILKRPFDMRQAVESALRVTHPLAQKKSLQLRTSIGPGVGTINNDRRRVEQVLINLLNNAVKFTERGEVSIECQVSNGWLETSVRDHGIGIKPEDLGKLFKPFQQIDTGPARSHEGTGLGLSICKRLVTAMGGDITVESQWGVGSIFKFTLPV